MLKEKGYDGIISPNNEIVVFDKSQIKTKSQLIDIWNKANQPTDLVSEAKKYKTAEEFVKGQPKLYHGTSKELEINPE